MTEIWCGIDIHLTHNDWLFDDVEELEAHEHCCTASLHADIVKFPMQKFINDILDRLQIHVKIHRLTESIDQIKEDY